MLYWASQNGQHDVVQTLLGAGAEVNIARSDVSHVMFYNYTCTFLDLHENYYM